MNRIKLLNKINGFHINYDRGDIIEVDEPYQGFNEDGTFTICQGMGLYHTIDKEDFEIIENG